MTQTSATAVSSLNLLAPRTSYVRLAKDSELPANALFAVTFGDGAITSSRAVGVQLQPLIGAGLAEIWYANGAVTAEVRGPIRYSADDHFLAGVIEVDEREHRGILAATAFAYRAIAGFQASSPFPHLLRTWNYFGDINRGDGDSERYREFCSGRVTGLEGLPQAQYPAATVIGRRAGDRILQVYWLAGRQSGLALENPRQLSAYLYPRQYGQTSPTFSRAMLVAPDVLMVSGTASIVGHASQHAGSVTAQVDEILANLDSLLTRAHAHAPALPPRFGRHTLIKAYLRNRADLPVVESKLRAHLPADASFLVLHGDVCRADLLVEFDCLHAAG